MISYSKVSIQIEVLRKGVAKGYFFKHLAPITVNQLIRSMPLEGRVSKFEDSFVYFISGLTVGSEKARTSFKRGEIAFLPLNGSVCFFLKDTVVSRGMNPLGKVDSGIEVLEGAGPGDVISIRILE
ncbi:MAG: cyclophilin-like fold protein [Nitrososphaerota archaeon]|nr:cyclophilin-like fold protein [Nitrososphaerales archaeon]MDW8044750.1 cyclophilin-like fold protein [Nitrososphaerota archaeon]